MNKIIDIGLKRAQAYDKLEYELLFLAILDREALRALDNDSLYLIDIQVLNMEDSLKRIKEFLKKYAES